jgi:hypothetical protein
MFTRFLNNRYANPINKASTLTSPIHPGMVPINKSSVELCCIAASSPFCFNKARGVAEDISAFCVAAPARAIPRAGTQFDICTGNEIMRNTLPIRAGLNGLFPNPPYTCFAIPTATNTPINSRYHGNEAVTLRESKSPVTAALPSGRKSFFFRKNLMMENSISSALNAPIIQRNNACQPK